MKLLLLALALASAESPAMLHLAAAPLLEQQTLDTDLERLHGLADDLGFRMQGSQGELRDAVSAAQSGLSRPTVWRRPKLQAPKFVVYVPTFAYRWEGPLPPGDASLSPFFRHNGQLYLAIRRELPSRWPWTRKPVTVVYRIRPDGRALPILELPSSVQAETFSVIQAGRDRFLIGRLVVDFKPE